MFKLGKAGTPGVSAVSTSDHLRAKLVPAIKNDPDKCTTISVHPHTLPSRFEDFNKYMRINSIEMSLGGGNEGTSPFFPHPSITRVSELV
jgi:hypothetical protein